MRVRVHFRGLRRSRSFESAVGTGSDAGFFVVTTTHDGRLRRDLIPAATIRAIVLEEETAGEWQPAPKPAV